MQDLKEYLKICYASGKCKLCGCRTLDYYTMVYECPNHIAHIRFLKEQKEKDARP